MKYNNANLIFYCSCMFCSVSLLFDYMCMRLLFILPAGVPSSRATFGFPQYCACTCARFGCTRHAICVDSKPKKKKKKSSELTIRLLVPARPMNHVKMFKGWPRRDASWEWYPRWYT